MSMFLSLDALDAATNATSAPRAAVFQPKVKPRARKGGGIADSRPVISAPQDVPIPAVVSSQATAVKSVCVSETSSKAVEAQSQSPTTAECSGIKHWAGEPPSTIEDSAPTVDDAVVPPETEFSWSQPQNGSSGGSHSRVQDELPQVAVRSDFPVPPVASVENLLEVTADEPSNSQERKSADLPERRQRVLSPRRAAPEGGSPASGGTEDLTGFKEADSNPEARRTVLEEEGTPQDEDDAEPVSELLPTNKRSRKRAFPHSTSQTRGVRRERAAPVPKIDLSETDLSNPGKLTMREIIRRAEAIERRKVKAEAAKKSEHNDGKQKQTLLSPGPSAITMAPQVQVIDGRIVINEQSLTVGAYATSMQNTESYTRVEENASRLNYNSYSNRTPTERWKTEDTEVFYRALHQFGTDFELILHLFPGRTRRQVKAKFKKEERSNPRRLQDALSHRPKDQVHYTDMITRLKADEAEQFDDPFANILAYTKDAAMDDVVT